MTNSNYTFIRAFDVVWGDVADCVYQHPTPLQALQYALNMTREELENSRGDDEDGNDIYEAYLVVREHHGIDRPDR